MFNKKDASAGQGSLQASAAPISRKRAGRSAAPSIISSDLVVMGSFSSAGDIQVDGRVEGDVQCVSLVIGDKAFVNGEIIAEDVTIRGRVQGSIRARKVLLCATSHVEGSIVHETFAVENGAFFDGNCRHHENPLSDEAGAKRLPFVDFHKADAPATAALQMVTRASDSPRPIATVAPIKSGA